MLETSQAKYADLYDFSPVGYFTLDRSGLIRELNLTGANMLGTGKRLLLAKPFQNFVEPAYRTVFRDHLSKVFTTQTNQTCGITIRKKDGSLCHVQLHSLSFHTGEGDPGLCRMAVSDVTERQRMENALRQSEIRFKTIFENSVDAVGLWKDARHVLVNPSYLSLFGYSSNEELAGKSILDVIAPGERERVQEYARARAQGGSPPREYETRGFKKDGTEFIIDIKVTTFTISPDTYSLSIIRDITEHRKVEEVVEKGQRRACGGQQGLGGFFLRRVPRPQGAAAPHRGLHDPRSWKTTPASFDETAKDYFHRVTSASHRMSQLIDAMLNMARLQPAPNLGKIPWT